MTRPACAVCGGEGCEFCPRLGFLESLAPAPVVPSSIRAAAHAMDTEGISVDEALARVAAKYGRGTAAPEDEQAYPQEQAVSSKRI